MTPEVDTEANQAAIKTREDRPTNTVPIGDNELVINENGEVEDDATWGEVCQACCVHSPKEWAGIAFGLFLVCFFLYFFLLGLDLLGTGAKVMGGCTAGALFGDDTNPIAGLMIGILATVLLQSSSTTTSIIVSLVGAGSISVRQGIYMIMGANIGTSVTNTIVALGHLGIGDQLERAFAGAVVHDMFNFMSVAVLLPVEIVTGYLYRLTGAMVRNAETKDGDSWDGPVKKIVEPLGKFILIENKKVISGVAKGESCDDFYPIVCEDDNNPTQKSCSEIGLISCDKDTNRCPAFFQPQATRRDDQISGLVVFIIGLAILFVCLLGLVTILQKMLLGASSRIIYKATNINGYLAMVVGAGITMIVQSSSITTSALTPLVGMGVLRLEEMLPLTLGANIGTTLTAILASLVSDGTDSLRVALAHLFFNISGILVFYPIPFMRHFPLQAARQLGKATRAWRGFPVAYIIVAFFIIPLIFLGVSYLFTQDSKGLTVLGSFLVVIVFFVIAYVGFICKFRGGREKFLGAMQIRQRRHNSIMTLSDDMEYLKARVAALSEHTGYSDDDVEADHANTTGAKTDNVVGTPTHSDDTNSDSS